MSDTGGSASVTVIIPTTGEPRGLDGLRRAVASVQGQTHSDVELLIVANGRLADSNVLDAEQSVRAGRSAMTTLRSTRNGVEPRLLTPEREPHA
jgi:hypothetical protein